MGPGERIAVADLGTNSTRLLVADAGSGGTPLSEIDRRTTVTRLERSAVGQRRRDAISGCLSEGCAV